MKAFKKIIVAVCLITTGSVFAQSKPDSLGLPGDNFDLPGALETFKKSDNLEAFEKAINSSDNEINNLDLNGDGEVDYIKVVDNKEGEAHTIVLQTAVTKGEIQDVAVIEIEKTKEGNAHIQIVGDEELYGKDYIIEPKEEKTVSAEKIKSDTETDDVYKSKNDQGNFNNSSGSDYNNNSNVVVNVWAWPSVQYIYGPAYVVYVSPWYWGYYPGWWTPWYPVYWRNHYWRAHHYHHHYHHCNYYRSPNVHKGYYGRRMTAETVRDHKRTGYYNERQIAYKDNVKPGRKYNSMPANPEKKINKRAEGNPKDINGQPQNNNTRSEQKGETKSPKQPKQVNEQPKNESKPNWNKQEQKNNEPKINQQPKQENTQPKRQEQKNEGMTKPPKQQGGNINTGGGGKNVGGNMGGGNNGGGGRNTGGGGGGGRRQK